MDTPVGEFITQSECTNCSGSGQTYKTKCDKCNGSGIEEVQEEIKIVFPSGLRDGDTLYFDDKGNAIKNGECGKLMVIIGEIPHEVYRRFESDLYYDKKLTYYEIILGVKVEIPTIDGGKIKVDIPEYSDNTTILRLKGKGMKIINTDNRGDLLLNITMIFPKQISDEERILLEKIKEINEKVENQK